MSEAQRLCLTLTLMARIKNARWFMEPEAAEMSGFSLFTERADVQI